MEELLNKLIEVDKNARKRVSKAKKANANALEELEKKRLLLMKENEQKFADELAKAKKSQADILNKMAEKIDADFQKSDAGLQALYEKKHDEWIESIFNGVIE